MAYATTTKTNIVPQALAVVGTHLGVKTVSFSPSISTGTGRLEITEKDGFCYYYELPDCTEKTIMDKLNELVEARDKSLLETTKEENVTEERLQEWN